MLQTKSYQVDVYGPLWDGSMGVYTYPVPPVTMRDVDTDEKLVELIDSVAADFAGVRDFRVIESVAVIETRGGIKTSTYRCRTRRGFRNGMTAKRWTRITEKGWASAAWS